MLPYCWLYILVDPGYPRVDPPVPLVEMKMNWSHAFKIVQVYWNHMKLCEMLWQQMKFLQEKGILRNFWLLLIVTAAWGHRQRVIGRSVQSVLKNSFRPICSKSFWFILQSVFGHFVFETEILSSSLSFLIDRFTWAAGLLRSTLTLGAPLKAIGFNVALACLARIIVRPTVAWLHKMRWANDVCPNMTSRISWN